MTYAKPQLRGYTALASIMETGPSIKISGGMEPFPINQPTDPAYQADE